ncbi:MAG TPA: agmatine deiminase family protein [Vicinamibacterales bacterium]
MTQPDTPRQLGFRMPAEWQPHAATWMAWPHDDEQWVGMLEPAREEFATLVDAVARAEQVELLVADEESEQDARRRLTAQRIRIHRVPHQDLWLRDSGPTFLTRRAEIALIDWEFNGWGGKYPAELDNEVPSHLARILGGPRVFKPGFVMEGGSIEVDGRGTVLTTRQCLLAPTRNPGMSEAEIEHALREWLNVSHVIWLDDGLEGDHTDGHIDTITRFAGPGTIVTAVCEDRSDPNHAVLAANLERLRAARDPEGRRYRIVELPIPREPAYFEGARLPLTYANFYIANGAVLVPVYGDANDARAVEILRPLFPGREVVPVMSRALITGGGSFHCVTQQQPVGESGDQS